MCPRAAEHKQAGREIDTLPLNDAATTIRTAPNTFTSGVAFTEEVPNSNSS